MRFGIPSLYRRPAPWDLLALAGSNRREKSVMVNLNRTARGIYVGVALTIGVALAPTHDASATTGPQYCASAKTELDKLNVFLKQSTKAVTASAGNPAKLKISMAPVIAQYRETITKLETTAPADISPAIKTYLDTLFGGLLIYEKVGFDAKKLTPAMLVSPKTKPEFRSAVAKLAVFVKNTCKADPAAVLGAGNLS